MAKYVLFFMLSIVPHIAAPADEVKKDQEAM